MNHVKRLSDKFAFGTPEREQGERTLANLENLQTMLEDFCHRLRKKVSARTASRLSVPNASSLDLGHLTCLTCSRRNVGGRLRGDLTKQSKNPPQEPQRAAFRLLA